MLTPLTPEQRSLPADPEWTERTRSLRLIAVPASRAIDRFNSGKADAVLCGKFEDFPLAASASLSRGAIRLDPVSGLFGLVFAHDDGFFAQPDNREAIAMAIDRDSLSPTSMGIGGWTPTTRIVLPGTQGDIGTIGERWAGLTIDRSARRGQGAGGALARRQARPAADFASRFPLGRARTSCSPRSPAICGRSA